MPGPALTPIATPLPAASSKGPDATAPGREADAPEAGFAGELQRRIQGDAGKETDTAASPEDTQAEEQGAAQAAAPQPELAALLAGLVRPVEPRPAPAASLLDAPESVGLETRLGPAGLATGGEVRVNTTTYGEQEDPSVTALADGGWLVSWTSLNQGGSGWGIYQRRYSSTGEPAGSETRVNTTTESIPSDPGATALADGGWLVSWTSHGQDGNGAGIYQQRYSAGGEKAGAETRVNTETAHSESAPAVTSLADGGWLVSWEKSIYIFHEQAIQHAFLGAEWFIRVMNIYYGTLHFIITAGLLVWLFVKRHAAYRRMRNLLGATTGLALIGYWSFPLAPPRLYEHCDGTIPALGPEGGLVKPPCFVDTLEKIGGLWNYQSSAAKAIANAYAAMPSLHFGWSLWCCIVIWRHVGGRRGHVLAVLYPCLTLFAIVVTANHYFLDAAGGAIILLGGLAIVRWRERRASTQVAPAV